jgi:hypothetical protein
MNALTIKQPWVHVILHEGTRVNDWSAEETADPLNADDRNFYKVERWTRDGSKVDRLLYAGNNLEKVREMPRRLCIRLCMPRRPHSSQVHLTRD